ncbi:unnamed protein product (macronuclear) [Paramecium tetraurelia]|uniref:Cyclin-dependent kinase 2 homolog n=1 Tax=Paramecium tetraurelia TaxID=5888 RepID=A0CH45_PARTE|nr:uncharacterized protein GSPATT00007552001 [Paramecium tetraurelia]CAK70112.1 unnamed protein product [Paramecium tetraurelia]|eukprot:XP_001437509.1 hypothetical protein (macronuclear) [Paramecium tetraurelia strain d4-2]
MSQISKYQLLGKVGSGVYGDVYKAINTSTGKIVAIKKIKKQSQDQGISQVALRETSILQTVQCENIVKLIEIEYVQECIRLVMEFYDVDLDTYLKSNVLDMQKIQEILHGILKGMNECHKKKCMHRDLKPQNILISKDGKVKIGDFGMARSFQQLPGSYTYEVITLWYRPPELLLKPSCYTTAIDVWSIGCIFAQMVLNAPLFAGDSEIQQMKLICDSISSKQDDVQVLSNSQFQEELERKLDQQFQNTQLTQDGLDLLKKLLQLNPVNRISCQEALRHPFFKNTLEPDVVDENMGLLSEYFKVQQ